MSNYTKTLGLLDRLIARLQANTGGEPLLPEDTQTNSQPPIETTTPIQPVTFQAIPQAEPQVEKKQPAKKAKNEGKKVAAKNQPEKPKLPEGVDPQVLVFAQVDLRVSEIVQCWKHPQSENLYCQKILVGNELREIASGLQQFVPLPNMRGKVIVMANLKPRTLGGFASNGMVVCASNVEHTQVQLLVPEGPLGERLYLDGLEELFPSQAVPIVKKTKVLEKTIEHFATDAEGFVVWKGYKLRTKAGFIKSNFLNAKVS